MVHVELASRLLGELGSAVDLRYNPDKLALFRGAALVMRVFCVGEAVSIPILRASWQQADGGLGAISAGCGRCRSRRRRHRRRVRPHQRQPWRWLTGLDAGVDLLRDCPPRARQRRD
jgi:hypothetical protein